MMLDAGKHILCEKPLTMNEKQSKKLLERAKEKNLLCCEAIWSRFFPSYRHLKSRLDNKELGDIKEVEVQFGFDLRAVDRLTYETEHSTLSIKHSISALFLLFKISALGRRSSVEEQYLI